MAINLRESRRAKVPRLIRFLLRPCVRVMRGRSLFGGTMSAFLDLIGSVLVLVIFGFCFFILHRIWRVLGLLDSVLNTFLARHGKLWNALDAISKRRDED